jgi:hypothetical protein
MTHRSNRILASTFTLLIAGLVAVGMAGCDSSGSNGGDDNEETPTAQVRFLHASADAGSVTVTANGNDLASNLSFSQNLTDPTTTEYKEVPIAGTIEVRGENGNALATVDATDLEGDKQYTVAVAGGVAAGADAGQDTPRALVLRDDLPELESGEVGLRVVHGSVALPAVDVFLIAPNDSARAENRRASGISFSETWPSSPKGDFQDESIPDDGRVLRVPTSEGPLDIPIATQTGPSVPTGRHATVVLFDRAPGAEFPWAAMLQVD